MSQNSTSLQLCAVPSCEMHPKICTELYGRETSRFVPFYGAFFSFLPFWVWLIPHFCANVEFFKSFLFTRYWIIKNPFFSNCNLISGRSYQSHNLNFSYIIFTHGSLTFGVHLCILRVVWWNYCRFLGSFVLDYMICWYYELWWYCCFLEFHLCLIIWWIGIVCDRIKNNQ